MAALHKPPPRSCARRGCKRTMRRQSIPASSSRTTSNPFRGSGGQQGRNAHSIVTSFCRSRARLGLRSGRRHWGQWSCWRPSSRHPSAPRFAIVQPLLCRTRRTRATRAAGRDSRRSCGARFPAARHAGGQSAPGDLPSTAIADGNACPQMRRFSPASASPAPISHGRLGPTRWRVTTVPLHNRPGRPRPRRARDYPRSPGRPENLDRKRRRCTPMQPQHTHVRLGPYIALGQGMPSSCFCAVHAIGRSMVLIRRCAVSSGGCRPAAIASRMSGASRASGSRALT